MDTTRTLPSGTVTFLFTDIKGSTRLWEQHPGAMPGALARHDALSRPAFEPTSRPMRRPSLRLRTAARRRGKEGLWPCRASW